MKIVIAYRAIDNIAGGVERMATALMNEMVLRDHEVHFITLDHKDATSFYEIDDRVSWHKIALGDYRVKASWSLRFKRARVGREILKDVKPDIIIAFQDGSFFSMYAYSLGLKIPVVLAERIAPGHFDFIKAGRFRALTYQLYRLASLITVQCESYIAEYPKYLRRKIQTIPNPVFPVSGEADPLGKDVEQKILLCVGRVGYQKNQYCLLESFSKLHSQYPDWRVVLAGGVEKQDEIDQLIQKLGIKDKVDLLGAVEDVPSLYKRSHLFCLPSRWEGFPNALAEAMSYGLPAVGFRGCGGVRDLIQHGESGLLAEGNENVATLTESLEELMKDDDKRSEMGKVGAVWIKQFEPQKMYDVWESTFLQVTRSKKA